MNTRELRTENLRLLVEAAGGPAAFSRLHNGVDPTYVSQLLNKHRSFGEKAARNMEVKIGLPEGALDLEPTANRARTTSARLSKPEPVWPFKIDKSRYDALSDTDKIRVEGILEGAIAAIESERVGKIRKAV